MVVSMRVDVLDGPEVQIAAAGIVMVDLEWAEVHTTGSMSKHPAFVAVRRSFSKGLSVCMAG